MRSEWAEEKASRDPRLAYMAWCQNHDATAGDLERQRSVVKDLSSSIQVLVVIDGISKPSSTETTLESLRHQSWTDWTAVVIGRPGSLSGGNLGAVDAGSEESRLSTSETVSDFPTAVNAVLQAETRSTFTLFLQAGDQLSPDCLYHVATGALRDPSVDLIFWDDDITENGKHHSPLFRPSWSPESLLGHDQIGRSFAVRTGQVRQLGGLRPSAGDGALWDLLLRADFRESQTLRIPRILAHLAGRPASPSSGYRTVAEHVAGSGMHASVSDRSGCVQIDWDLPVWPKASIVIPTKHNRAMVTKCLTSLAGTDYPAFEVIIVDNGDRTSEREAWYQSFEETLDLRVHWWSDPFNYSAVNNFGAGMATGDVLVFLNDDTEILDARWLQELSGWLSLPEIGSVGPQLIGDDGRIQFAGTVLGMNGFADHVFFGLETDAETVFGPVRAYRDVSALTGACLAIRRSTFELIGGFDERFILCGSDVALGLDLRMAGFRNLCTPRATVRHLESATRGDQVPQCDLYTSYWRYQSWLFGGDPYYSPNLSLSSRVPALRSPDEPSAPDLIGPPLGRNFRPFRQANDSVEALRYAGKMARASNADIKAVRSLHQQNADAFEPETINWFIPDFDSPFYGGINTAFRIADHLARNHGVVNRFMAWGDGPEEYIRRGIEAAFPALASAEIIFHDGSPEACRTQLPPADVSIATLWLTAYHLLNFPRTRRKFYLMQDFEPVFYPAGSLYALAEETYRLGLYGLCNTEVMRHIYESEYGGKGWAFTPAVDPTIFHAEGRLAHEPGEPLTLFVYARAGHWRNCWELTSLALKELKRRVGDQIRIIAAGSWAKPNESDDLDAVVKHLGLLDYRATGPLYRTCDIGLTLSVSKHPSYLPLELMACGVPSVAFDSPHFRWLMRNGENSLLAERTVDGIVDALERLVVDNELRNRLADQGLADIAANHSSWEKALAGVYGFLSNPEGVG